MSSVREPIPQKNIDGATIATAAPTWIDARTVPARDDAFALTAATVHEPASLTRGTLRIVRAAKGSSRIAGL
jgi:hypothetical protein